MKPLAIIAAVVAAFIAGLSCCQTKVVTKTETVQVEVPGPERVVTDTAEIARLTSQLAASESKSQERLAGWRAAEARYKYYEAHWEPKRQAGAQGSAGAVYQPRGLFRGRFR